MRKITSFDLVRTIAILGTILLHAILMQWTGADDARIVPGDPPPDIMVQAIFYIVTMAGLFFFISGAVNTITIFRRTMKNPKSLKQSVMGGIFVGALLILTHFFFIILVNPESGILFFLIKNDPESPVLLGNDLLDAMVHQDALAILGINAILISVILWSLLRDGGHLKSKRNYLILGVLGTIILIATPFIRSILFQVVIDLKLENKYFAAMAINIFCGDWFPIFPYLGYAIYGSMLGIALTSEVEKKNVFKIMLVAGIIWLIVGIIGLSVNFGALYTGLYEELSVRGMFFRSYLQFSQLGASLLIFIAVLYRLDYQPDEIYEKRRNRKVWALRVGLISLTAFLYEAIIRELLGKVATLLFPLWAAEIWSVAIFGLVNCIVWIILALYWEKSSYKYSLEWIIMKTVEKLSGKKSYKFAKNAEIE